MKPMTLELARNLSDAELASALSDAMGDIEAAFHQACIIVTVFEERGLDMPMLPSVFKYAAMVADGSLSPKAGFALSAFHPSIVNSFSKLHHAKQDALIDGEKFKIAVKRDGRVMSDDTTIFRVSPMQARLAFSEYGIVGWEEQGSFLLKSKSPDDAADSLDIREAGVKVSVDAVKKEIVINKTHVTVEKLIPALAALGYSVKPLYGKSFEPAKVK